MGSFPLGVSKLKFNTFSRHAFIGWLVVKNRLPIKERMIKWGSAGDTACVFCRNGIENRDHLLFECPFSNRIWKNVMGMSLISSPQTKWDDIVEWGIKNLFKCRAEIHHLQIIMVGCCVSPLVAKECYSS